MESRVAGRKKRILVFARFYMVRDFRNSLRPFENDFEISLFSDSKSDARDIRIRFYEEFARGDLCSEIDAADETEVVARCRLLRNLPLDRARRQLHAMARTLAEQFDSFQPDAALSPLVDDYTTHLFALLAERRGKRLVTISFGYFPGYALLNQGWAGAPFRCRKPDDAEVAAVWAKIADRAYRQDYKQPTRYNRLWQLKQTLRYRFKLATFALRARMWRDPLNYHFTALPYIVERRRMRDLAVPEDFSLDWEADLAREKARRPQAPVIYFPLAYFPEATIDYWIADRSILAYEDKTLSIVELLARDFIVLVKEHLHMSGARDRGFFAHLKAVPGVVSVNPAVFSNDVLNAGDAMIIGGGSAGIEATIRGVPVLSFAPNVYWFEHSEAAPLDLQKVGDWPELIRNMLTSHRPLGERERFEFLRSCLSSNARARPDSAVWAQACEADLAEVLRAA